MGGRCNGGGKKLNPRDFIGARATYRCHGQFLSSYLLGGATDENRDEVRRIRGKTVFHARAKVPEGPRPIGINDSP